MKYSYNWLQSHIEDPLPSAEILKETIIFHAFEVEDIEVLATDTIFDIKILPDRAGDCLSHYGMAREIAGLLGLNFKTEAYQFEAVSIPIALQVESKGCLRYKAVQIDGLKVGPSPAWLVKKLELVGQRSINNIVDATNYILLDTGQPTHVFDAAKVSGPIVVREARDGETITVLGKEDPSNTSEQEKVLKAGMIVIADNEKLLAIAGVKGGKAAEVTAETTSVILEIANFDPVSVRKASRPLGLATDASKRFENNLAPFTVENAAAQLVTLIQTLGGGTVTAMAEYYPQPQVERAISFTTQDIQRILGVSITDTEIVKVLDRYGYTYESVASLRTVEGTMYTLAVPLWRHDITGAHDMAEEFGRVIGYDTIDPQPIPFTPTVSLNEQYEKIRTIKFYLIEQGYSEVMTYSFRKKGDIMIAHGPKDKSALRTNLADGLKESYEMNRLNAALLGVSEVKEFEIGTVFMSGPVDTQEQINIALADKTGIHESSVDEYYEAHKDELAEIDVTTCALLSSAHVGTNTFKAWSLYPFIVRDIAVWVNGDTEKNVLEKIVYEFAEKYCARPPVLFDTFSKEGKTSVAYRFVFQSSEKTLTDEEVEKQFQIVVAAITEHSGMTIR